MSDCTEMYIFIVDFTECKKVSDIHLQFMFQKNLTATLKVCTDWTRSLWCFCLINVAFFSEHENPSHWNKCVMESVPVTLAWSCTTSSTRTLVGISLADGKHLQSIHSYTWIENLLG